jgi:hypothetical protein
MSCCGTEFDNGEQLPLLNGFPLRICRAGTCSVTMLSDIEGTKQAR